MAVRPCETLAVRNRCGRHVHRLLGSFAFWRISPHEVTQLGRNQTASRSRFLTAQDSAGRRATTRPFSGMATHCKSPRPRLNQRGKSHATRPGNVRSNWTGRWQRPRSPVRPCRFARPSRRRSLPFEISCSEACTIRYRRSIYDWEQPSRRTRCSQEQVATPPSW